MCDCVCVCVGLCVSAVCRKLLLLLLSSLSYSVTFLYTSSLLLMPMNAPISSGAVWLLRRVCRREFLNRGLVFLFAADSPSVLWSTVQDIALRGC